MKKRAEQISDFTRRWYKHLLAIPALVLLTVLIKLFNFSVSDPVSDEDYLQYFTSNYKVFGITIPKDLNFCGEQVPVNDFTVRESLERELLVNTYYQSQTVLLHKRASRWFPIIEPILKANGIPDDMKYVALAESGLTNAVSPQKAAGFWQLMPATATHYGLEISDEVDERYHLEKATEAACKTLKDAYERYGNWTLAAASYNLGMGGIDKQLEKQKQNSYYNLYLNEETARYIFRILALKEIISRPKAYGYHLRKKDLYPPIAVRKVVVDSSITDLSAFSISQGSSLKVLKFMNAWLLKNSLTNPNKKRYVIVFPAKGVDIYGLDDDQLPTKSSKVEDTSRFVTPQDLAHDSASRSFSYKVQSGETWKSVADKFGIEIEWLAEYNKRDLTPELKEGEEIMIPKR